MDLKNKKILVTGCAGFIGMHVSKKVHDLGAVVVGIDNLNSYYDPKLKNDRLSNLTPLPQFSFHKIDLSEKEAIAELMKDESFDFVIHLAAQPGVRYSLENPHAYIDSNITGFLNILEGCRHNKVQHLVYASSSSVYGANTKTPFAPSDPVDHPISLYAATKRSNELMAHVYAHLFSLPVTGLRFFTVYGPWGRPDMSPVIFANAISKGEEIQVFNEGQMERDFTYIDDIVDALTKIVTKIPEGENNYHSPDSSKAPFKTYNIGGAQCISLMDFIHTMEDVMGKKAKLKMMPYQPGDVLKTFADIKGLEEVVGFSPKYDVKEGLKVFAEWFKSYYK